MALPSVSADKILSAMARFDGERRITPQWANWQSDNKHRFALKESEQLYPVKQIISMATGVPVSSFHGGREANTYLKELGFEIELISLPSEIDTATALHELLIERNPHPVTPAEAYRMLAERFQLPQRLRHSF